MPVVVRPVDSEGEALFRLEYEIRKKREEEDEKLMEKYAQIEANYQKSNTEDGLTFCRLEESRQGSAWRRNSWPGLIRRLVEQQALSRWTIWDRMGETSICLVNGWECCSHGLTWVFSICLYFHFLTWFAVSHTPASPVANWDSTVF